MKKCNEENKRRYKFRHKTEEEQKSETNDGTVLLELNDLNSIKQLKPQFRPLLDRFLKSSSTEVKRACLIHMITLFKEVLNSTAKTRDDGVKPYEKDLPSILTHIVY